MAAERFVDAAAELCTEAVMLGVRGVAVVLHRESGSPALTIGNLPHGAREDLVAPLVGIGGRFGTVVFACGSRPELSLERELSMLVTQLSVWCTAHGIACLPELADAALPARQHQIARLAASGRTNAEIADDLGISVNTVKLRLKQVFERLHVNNRTELANVLRRLAPLDGVAEGVTHVGEIAITRAPR